MGNYTNLNGYATSFDAMPVEVQKALFDRVFNLGLTKLKSRYTKFNTAKKSENWGDAAKQSNRIGIAPARNKYVYDLFIKAQKKQNKP